MMKALLVTLLAGNLWTSQGLPICAAVKPDPKGYQNICLTSPEVVHACTLAVGTVCTSLAIPAGTYQTQIYWPATIHEQRLLMAGMDLPILGRMEAAWGTPSVWSPPLTLGLESAPTILQVTLARRKAAGAPTP